MAVFTILADLLSHHAAALFASLVLLCLSAAFSSCETSLFSLTAPELNRLRGGTGRIDRTIIQLHQSLQSLLPSLLFFNMLVNVGIYSLAAGIASDLGAKFGVGVAFVYSMASLLIVVFWGEVFPKQLAIASSLRASTIFYYLWQILLLKKLRKSESVEVVLMHIYYLYRSK